MSNDQDEQQTEPVKRRRWLRTVVGLVAVWLLIVAGIRVYFYVADSNQVSDACDQAWVEVSLMVMTDGDESAMRDALIGTVDGCSSGEWWNGAKKEMPEWAAVSSRGDTLSTVCDEVPEAKACR